MKHFLNIIIKIKKRKKNYNNNVIYIFNKITIKR